MPAIALAGLLRCAPFVTLTKYIDAPKPELYNLDKDPGERNNLMDSGERGRCRQTPSRTPETDGNRLRRNLPPVLPTPDAVRKCFRSLGYIAPGPRASASRVPPADPKDKLPGTTAVMKDALTRMEERRYEDSAIARFCDRSSRPIRTICSYGGISG